MNGLLRKKYNESLSVGNKRGLDDRSESSDESSTKDRKNNLGSKSSWRCQSFFMPDKCPRFHPGTVDLSPGWFMNRHEVLNSICIPSCHSQRHFSDLRIHLLCQRTCETP